MISLESLICSRSPPLICIPPYLFPSKQVMFDGNMHNIYCLPDQLSTTGSEISRDSGRRYSASL